MGYMIRMGIPEMQALWDNLQQMYRAGAISKNDEILYKKWGNALKKLAADPRLAVSEYKEIFTLNRVWDFEERKWKD